MIEDQSCGIEFSDVLTKLVLSRGGIETELDEEEEDFPESFSEYFLFWAIVLLCPFYKTWVMIKIYVQLPSWYDELPGHSQLESLYTSQVWNG